MQRAATPEPELPELPPEDFGDGEEIEGPGGEEPVTLLPESEDFGSDEEEPEHEIEPLLALEEAPPEDNEQTELTLDIAELLAFADEQTAGDTESEGPRDIDLGIGLDESREPLTGSAEEGTDEALEDLVNEELPELDADEPRENDDPAWLGEAEIRDEELPPATREPWRVVHVTAVPRGMVALGRASGGVLAAGNVLAWLFLDGRVASTSLGGARAKSLASLGDEIVVIATSGGEVLRVELRAARSSRIEGWRRALGERGGDAHEISVTSLYSGDELGLLVCTGGALLAKSDDAGTTWDSIELGGRVRALAPESRPAYALLSSHEGHALVRWPLDGGLKRVALDQVGEEVAAGETPLVAADGEVVAIGSRERGLAVSRDGGRTFVHVPGCMGLSAVAVGIAEGQPRVFANVFIESEERSLVMALDPSSAKAEIIAEVLASDDDDDAEAESGDDARLTALFWDASARCLWGAGELGVVRIEAVEPDES